MVKSGVSAKHMRDWFSGRMTAFQAVDKGSIPLSRTTNKNQYRNVLVFISCYWILRIEKRSAPSFARSGRSSGQKRAGVAKIPEQRRGNYS
ncbi:MAG: hypothetical protein QG568_267 [Patescibacteria group bacterium]|nr:hypothetical protein [Patescibacteria group bacterium]